MDKSKRKGSITPFALMVSIIVMIVTFIVFQCFRIYAEIDMVRNSTQTAIVGVMTDNWSNVYDTVREGYAGTYKISTDDSWDLSYTQGRVFERLIESLDLVKEDGKYIKYIGEDDNRRAEYIISDLELTFNNPTLAPVDNENNLNVRGYLSLEIPYKILEFENTVPIRLRLNAEYSEKF